MYSSLLIFRHLENKRKLHYEVCRLECKENQSLTTAVQFLIAWLCGAWSRVLRWFNGPFWPVISCSMSRYRAVEVKLGGGADLDSGLDSVWVTHLTGKTKYISCNGSLGSLRMVQSSV